MMPGRDAAVLWTVTGDYLDSRLVEGADGRIYGVSGSGPFAITRSGSVSRWSVPNLSPASLLALGADRVICRAGSDTQSSVLFRLSEAGQATSIRPVDQSTTSRYYEVTRLQGGADWNLYGVAFASSFPFKTEIFRLSQLGPTAPGNVRVVRQVN